MKILMISMDKTLLGEEVSGGDAVERHKKYGQFCDELHIIVLSSRGYKNLQLSENISVWPTNSKNKFNYKKDVIKIAENIHKKSSLDLVMCQDILGYIGIKVSKKLKRRFLLSIHGDFFNNKNNFKWTKSKWFNNFLIFMLKRVVKKADGMRVVSQGIKNKLIKKGINKNKIRVIPTPVNLSVFLNYNRSRVYELKQKYFNPAKDGTSKNILFVGRLEPVKNLSWFLDVFAKIKEEYKNINFLIAGKGSELENLKLKVKNLKLENSVKFLGAIKSEDLTNYYHLADIVVLPSTSESFGKVLIEAGASGIPCIASATTGAKEIISSSTKVTADRKDKKTGYIVPINDKKQMIEKILDLLKDKNLAKRIGENAKEHIKENFDNKIIIQKIVRFWSDLISS